MSATAPSILDERLAELEKARPWSPRLVSKLEALIASPDPWELYRVDPLRFARQRGVDEGEAIDLFLHAAKLGLFHMEWRLICPSCSDTVRSFESLTNLHKRCFCSLCHLETEANLDDYIRVSFNLQPQLRRLPFHDPESLSLGDYVFRYRLDPRAVVPGLEIPEVELLGKAYRVGGLLAPGAAEEAAFSAADGAVLLGHDFESGHSFMAPVQAGGAERLDLAVDESGFQGGRPVRPGPLRLRVENRRPGRAAWAVVEMTPNRPNVQLRLEPGLDGNRLLSSQTFRNLFRSETVGGNEGIGVRDLALLFTDLKGSTALYERIGDLKAFALVQQHFEHLSKAVAAHRGAVVKTIGDAVMACFSSAADAAAAAVDMLREIEAFNRSQGHREILLKVGIHRGSSIAVTLNERLDYFGQTVNIAARVQGLADAEEICVTEAAYKAPGVAEALQGLPGRWEQASLKGVRGSVPVLRLSLAPAAAPKRKAKIQAQPKAKTKVKPKAKAKAKAKTKPKPKAKPKRRAAAKKKAR